MSAIKVLPCPVCGETPGVVRNGDEWVVFCDDHHGASAKGKTREDAIRNFNEDFWQDESCECEV